MNVAARFVYRAFAKTLRVCLRLRMDFRVIGLDEIPPGPKLYVSNHISSMDPYWLVATCPDLLHIVVGPAYQSRFAGWVLDRFEQINAMPAHRARAVDHAVRLLERGESVFVAPEGDIQPTFELGHFYPGVARMYRRTGVPIIPMALLTPRSNLRRARWLDMKVEERVYRGLLAVRGLYCVHVGAPMRPEVTEEGGPAEDAAIMEAIKQRIASLTEDIRVNLCPCIDWMGQGDLGRRNDQ